MSRTLVYSILLLALTTGLPHRAAAGDDDKQMSGMAIVGNDEAPKSLVIVPWKSSQLGDALGVPRLLDDGRQPVDPDVFKRELDYYEIRSASRGRRSPGTP